MNFDKRINFSKKRNKNFGTHISQIKTIMKGIKIFASIFFLCASFSATGQESKGKTDFEEITETLMWYIDGTANGEPDKVRKAFHPDFNLYSVTDADSVRVWKGEDYINGIRVGQKNSRVGRIISIDVENNAAMAKAEILIPGWRSFTDYFLLLKYQGAWKIIQKSYTWRDLKTKEKE